MNKKTNILLLFFLSFFLLGCSDINKNIDKIHTLYEEDLSSYFIIRGTPHNILNYNGNKEAINSYNINIYIESLINKELENVNFEVYALNFINQEEILYINKQRTGDKTPIFENIVYDSTVGGNGYREIYGNLSYSFNDEPKNINFYEEIILIDDNNLKQTSYPENMDNSFVDMEFNVIDENDYYNLSIVFDFKELNRFHIDFQSWLTTIYGGIYPFIGIYNYKKKQLTIPNNYIYKDLYIDYLYIRGKCYNAKGEVTELLYKTKIKDLVERYK